MGLGLCWKAGTAAEVIGIPDGSIGEKLYHAKVYLNTSELFAWTLVIILVSLLFEKLFLAVLDGTDRQAGKDVKRMAIQIKNLSKSYGDHPVLTGFNAEFPEGKTTCIMGASGIGKTTLLRLMMGLEKPDGGEILGLAGEKARRRFPGGQAV